MGNRFADVRPVEFKGWTMYDERGPKGVRTFVPCVGGDVTGTDTRIGYVGAVSVQGARSNMEDAFQIVPDQYDTPFLINVADGMGGHHEGKATADTAVREAGLRLWSLHHGSSKSIVRARTQSLIGATMEHIGGTTLTSLFLARDPQGRCWAFWAHIGDSAIFVAGTSPNGEQTVRRITTDHSEYGFRTRKRQEFESRGMEVQWDLEAYQKNILHGFLGDPGCSGKLDRAHQLGHLEFGVFQVQPRDTIALMTDGMYDKWEKPGRGPCDLDAFHMMRDIVACADAESPQAALRALVDAAAEVSKDNTTLVCLRAVCGAA